MKRKPGLIVVAGWLILAGLGSAYSLHRYAAPIDVIEGSQQQRMRAFDQQMEQLLELKAPQQHDRPVGLARRVQLAAGVVACIAGIGMLLLQNWARWLAVGEETVQIVLVVWLGWTMPRFSWLFSEQAYHTTYEYMDIERQALTLAHAVELFQWLIVLAVVAFHSAIIAYLTRPWLKAQFHQTT